MRNRRVLIALAPTAIIVFLAATTPSVPVRVILGVSAAGLLALIVYRYFSNTRTSHSSLVTSSSVILVILVIEAKVVFGLIPAWLAYSLVFAIVVAWLVFLTFEGVKDRR